MSGNYLVCPDAANLTFDTSDRPSCTLNDAIAWEVHHTDELQGYQSGLTPEDWAFMEGGATLVLVITGCFIILYRLLQKSTPNEVSDNG